MTITKDDRVASVLAKDERLVEVFVAASPAFAKLRNGAMRRTLAKLVTIEQAARVAGVDLDALLDRLNRAGAHDPHGAPVVEAPIARATSPEAASVVPAALLATPPERLIDVDVRDDLRAGREPFQRIFEAARALPDGSVLRVRAIFEPAPLYGVLARYGLAHATERLADDDWRVWFHRAAKGENASVPDDGATRELRTAGLEDDVVVVDVRDLEPPEPMVQTLEALAALPRGKTLVQINRRVPQFLLPKLKERGFTWEIREQSEDLVRLFIRHAAP